ncbi:MAG: rod shape-determining protein RodA [Chloroflexi bacterium]|nr:rod shape-determining protein RodA [Chloroflexota bacterium]
MLDRRIWRNFDPLLLLTAMVLMFIGVAMIHSATAQLDSEAGLWEQAAVRQAIYGFAGLVILFLVAGFNYRYLASMHWLLYVGMLVTLAALFVVGHTSFGATSWFHLSLFPIQPSELSKIVVVIFLAKYLSDHQEHMTSIVPVLVSLLFVAAPIGLIYLQPDLGTAVVILAIWFGVVFAAGLRPAHIAVFAAISAVSAPAIWASMKGYMRERILVFLNPASDVSGISYNVQQALISVGSGGLLGKGYGQGTQSQLYFLRVRHTDFIFSVLAEEFGFMGAILLLTLFAVLLWRILRAASLAQDAFGRLIAVGVATMIFFQAVVNIAVNVNLLPVTGLPLPFVSYGGSALTTMLIGVGLVENVVMRYRKLDFA